MTSLKVRISEDPWDAAAWTELAEGMSRRNPSNPANLEEQQSFYEEMLSRFPTAARHWKRYAELEMAAGNTTKVKSVFSRCLLSCPNVDLWQSYLSFIQKENEAKGVEGQPETRKAFEYCLERVGQAADSGPLWLQYVQLLQSARPGTTAYAALFGGPAAAGQEDAARSAALRSAFQRALAVPTASLEVLWGAYETFELGGGANKSLGRRALDDARPRYQAARAAWRTRRSLLDSINHDALAVPAGKGGYEQQELARSWRELIAWESSNPQRLDQPALAARVVLAYEQALAVLRHLPDMWLDFAAWHQRQGGGGTAAASAVLDRGRKVLPDALMLHFAAADIHEAAGAIAEAKAIYESLVESLEAEPGEAPKDPGTNGEQPSVSKEEQEAASLVWIQYQRFERRSEGVRASRQVFLRARKAAATGWQVYAASARLEWAGDKNEKVPINIWELGLRLFLSNPDYVLAYIDFLIGVGNMDNARALFERALAAAAAEGAHLLWDRFLAFEYEYGSLDAALRVQSRRAEALAELAGDATAPPQPGDDVHVAVLKYRYEALWPAAGEAAKEHLARVTGEAPPLEPPYTAAERVAGALPSWPSESHDASQAELPPTSQPSGPASANGDIKQLPAELASLLSSLPPPSALKPPAPDVDAVIDVLMDVDLSPMGISAGDAAVAAGQLYPRARPSADGAVPSGASPAPASLPPPVQLPPPLQPPPPVQPPQQSYAGAAPQQNDRDAGPPHAGGRGWGRGGGGRRPSTFSGRSGRGSPRGGRGDPRDFGGRGGGPPMKRHSYPDGSQYGGASASEYDAFGHRQTQRQRTN